MHFLNENLVRSIVKKAGNKFFTVHYLKDNGELRALNGRLVESAPTHKNHSELFCIELEFGKVRTARYNKILGLASGGFIVEAKDYNYKENKKLLNAA